MLSFDTDKARISTRYSAYPFVQYAETFVYDALNRVTKISTLLPGQSTASDVDVTYNTRGDILTRSDVGTYYYTGTSGCGTGSFSDGRYAVKAITPTVDGSAVTNGKNTRYCYDLNGDMVSGDGRTITWSAFGMPAHIEKGTISIDLAYGPDRARFKRIDVNQTGTTTTYYVAGGAFEVSVAPSGLKTQRAYVAGAAVVVRSETALATWGVAQTRYFLKDHLGPLAAETDEQGVIQQSYQAFNAYAFFFALPTRVPRAGRKRALRPAPRKGSRNAPTKACRTTRCPIPIRAASS